MPREIERKFLVTGKEWQAGSEAVRIRQGYLTTGTRATVRIRVAGEGAWITVKGDSRGPERAEFEYPIPRPDAEFLLTLCEQPLIEKVRHRVKQSDWVWEVDAFEAENAGLVLAEIELESEGADIDLPVWVGPEVTGDYRYYNVNLSRCPYRTWPPEPGEGPSR